MSTGVGSGWKATAPLLRNIGRGDWSHHKDGVPERVQQIERSRLPILVSRWAQNCDLGAPLTIVGIRIIHLEGHAGVSTVTFHRAIQRQPDRSALDREVQFARPPTPRTSLENPIHPRRSFSQQPSRRLARSVSLVPCLAPDTTVNDRLLVISRPVSSPAGRSGNHLLNEHGRAEEHLRNVEDSSGYGVWIARTEWIRAKVGAPEGLSHDLLESSLVPAPLGRSRWRGGRSA